MFHVIGENQDSLNKFPPALILAQLDTLNAHFTRNNTNIRFCLAQNLPLSLVQGGDTWADFGTTVTPGQAGITYTLDLNNTLSPFDLSSLNYTQGIMPGALPFPPEEYLSIYVVDSLLLPNGGEALGVSNIGPSYAAMDGIGIHYNGFLNTTATTPILGKVLVHEVGHWLGLKHVFGDIFGDDGICDTYEQGLETAVMGINDCVTPYTTSTTCPVTIPYNQGENYMDYHLENCLSVFTGGQTNRMHQILDVARPLLHSQLNLINTGIRQPSGCVDDHTVTAAFTSSTEYICNGEPVDLEGSDIAYANWTWSVHWDSTLNNNQPAPLSASMQLTDTSGQQSRALTQLFIDVPGTWSIVLTVQDTVNGLPFTIMDTLSITVEDCSTSPQRYRYTSNLNNSDWKFEYLSVDTLTTVGADTTEGYIITGSSMDYWGQHTGILMQVDLTGQVVWRRTISHPGGAVRLFDVASGFTYQGQPNCYALTGYLNNGTRQDVLVMVVSKQGTTLYQETFPLDNANATFNIATGFHLIALSSAFNNQLAVVGFVGDGIADLDDRAGFILGIDPNLGIGNALQWQQFYESITLTGNDYDVAVSLVEITADFGNGPEATIIVGGNANRALATVGKGIFFSGLTPNTTTGVVERWRRYYETIGGNIGSNKLVSLAWGNNSLVAAATTDISHGTTIISLDETNGNIKNSVSVFGIQTYELLIKDAACVLAGVDPNYEVTTFKIPLPTAAGTSWNTLPQAISRNYTATSVTNNYFSPYYPHNQYFYGAPQSMVTAPNGGYFVVMPNQLTTATNNPNGQKEVSFLKLDERLVAACTGAGGLIAHSLPTPLDSSAIGDTIQLQYTPSVDTTTIVNAGPMCMQQACTGFATHIEYGLKCPEDTVQLDASSYITSLANTRYQWSPLFGLDSSAAQTLQVAAVPGETDILYLFEAIDTITGCVVLTVRYFVINHPSTLNSRNIIVDNCAQTVSISSNPTLTNIQWQQVGTGLLADTTMTIIPNQTGYYLATGTNAYGCMVATDTAFLQVPTPLSVSSVVQPISCAGAADGEVVATAQGGITPYTYYWSTGQLGNTLSSLGAGTYTVTVQDVCGIFLRDTVIVTAPAILSNTNNASVTGCGTGISATITTATTGGTTPYQYLWSTGATTASLHNLTTGTYTVTVTDANQCSTTSSSTLTVPDSLQLGLSSSAVQCATANSGSVTSGLTGGSLPYVYQWSNNATTASLSNVAANTYCLTVTDSRGCLVTDCATVAPAADLQLIKTSSATTAVVGDTITYTIALINNCQSPLTVALEDTLPLGLLMVQSTLNYQSTDRRLSDVISLPAGDSTSLTYMVLIATDGSCGQGLTLNNRAWARDTNSSALWIDSAQVVINEINNSCDTSALQLTFQQAIDAGLLLPMTGVINATNTAQNVVVNGQWRLLPGQNYDFAAGSTIIMEGGAEWIVSPDAALSLDKTTVQGCECLWYRILVEKSGSFSSSNNSKLEDAQYALQTLDASTIEVTDTRFENNFIGWYVAPHPDGALQNVFVNKFEDNLFIGQSMKQPYAGAPTTPGLTTARAQVQIPVSPAASPTNLVRSLAGVYLWDVAALNLNTAQPSNSNTFTRLTAGIVAFNSNLSINSGTFNNINKDITHYDPDLSFHGCGIHAQAESWIPTLRVRGMRQTTTTNTFQQCVVGISGLGVSMDIDFCGMNCPKDMGIRATLCQEAFLSFKDNHMTNIERVGIGCYYNDIETELIVAYNNLFLQNSTVNALQFRAGIAIVEAGLHEHKVEIQENTVESINSQFGIQLSGVKGAKVTGNEVVLAGNYNQVDRAGIAVLNSEANLTCNSVPGDNTVLNSSRTRNYVGATITNSQWQCNTADKADKGMYFEGISDVNLIGNEFQDHQTGLLLEGNAIIGQQPHHGNLWIGNAGGNPDAVNLNTSTAGQGGSYIEIDGSTGNFNDLVPNNFANQGGWIDPFASGNNLRCDGDCNVVESTSLYQLSSYEQAVANQSFSTSSYTSAAVYQAQRQLYRNLCAYPSRITLDSSLVQFMQRCQNNCISHFDSLAEACRHTLTLAPSIHQQLQGLQGQATSCQDSIQVLDSIWQQQPQTSIRTARLQQQQGLQRIQQQQAQLLNTWNTQQRLQRSILANRNQAFNTSVLHESHEQQLVQLYLTTLGAGKATLTSQERSQLRQLAATCPQEGGVSVHQARALLSLVEDVNVLDFSCVVTKKNDKLIEEEMTETARQAWAIKLYPNPTQQQLTVESTATLSKGYRVQVYNALGQVVLVPNKQIAPNSLSLEVGQLPAGMYVLQLRDGEERATLTFVVIE